MAVLPPDPVFVLRTNDMGPVHSLCFHGTERLLAGTSAGCVYLWDLQTNRSLLHFKAGPDPILAIHHFADTLLTQDKYSTVKLWRITNSGYVLDHQIATNNSSYCRLDANEARNIVIVSRDDHQVEVLDARNLESQLLLSPPIAQQQQPAPPLGTVMAVKLVEISEDVLFVLGAYESGVVCLWDLSSGGGGKLLHSLQFLPNGGEDSPLTLDYDVATNRGLIGTTSDQVLVFGIDRRLRQLVNKKTDIAIKNRGVNRVRIRPQDQKVFATAGWDGRVRVFSWKSLRPLAVLTEHKRNVLDLVYSPGKVSMWKAPVMATAGEDGSIALWDLYN